MSSPGRVSGPVFELGKSMFKRAVAQQGGLLDGEDPTTFNTADPLRIWVIQLGVIIITTQVLAFGLKKLRQPKVIAEVIGGIVLGPTILGRIPGFSQHIFPPQSRPYLTLTADIGLVLFLFLVGLEIDTNLIKRNARTSFIISAGGILLPFGLGAAVAVPIFHQFVDQSQSFPHFLLFVGVAFSITAFPVLCRILTELKMLDDVVGVIVLSAGVGNDIVGWILLALTVALVNASSGVTAVYVLLVSVAWTLFILYPIRWAYKWLARVTGSDDAPTPLFMTATILLVFASAFMTDVIGVNAIFGGFLAGLVIPRDGGLNITITEKLEDMVAIIFLPLYFTLSGLNTNLGLLNTGRIWGYTIMILVIAYLGKFSGGTLAARVAGFGWRTSMTIGTLMSCKGLIELIVLNVGLSAGILDTQVFSMFVLEAVVLTFAATPVALWLYPPHMRIRSGAHDTGVGPHGAKKREVGGTVVASDFKDRYLVVLDKIGHIPSIMAVTQLLQPAKSTGLHGDAQVAALSEITALRLIELTDRTSDLMRSSVPEELMARDPLLSLFRVFGGLNDLIVSDRLSVASLETYHENIGVAAEEAGAQLILLSWTSPLPFPTTQGAAPLTISPTMASVEPGLTHTPQVTFTSNPLEALFRGSGQHGTMTRHEAVSTVAYSNYIRRVFASAPADVAVFVENGTSISAVGSKFHLFLPFFGGPDDRTALEFVVQLCTRDLVTATIVRVTKEAQSTETESDGKETTEHVQLGDVNSGDTNLGNTIHSAHRIADTIYPNVTTQTRLASDTADNICWSKFAPADGSGSSVKHSAVVQSSLSRIQFTSLSSSSPLHDLVKQVAAFPASQRSIVVVGRAKRLAVESHQDEMSVFVKEAHGIVRGSVGKEMRKTLGDVASAFVISGSQAGLLVMQAAVASRTDV